MSDLPILSTLEKKLILVLGLEYLEYGELLRFSGRDIKESLNEFNEKYKKPYQYYVPYATLERLEEKVLIETVIDTVNGRKIKYFMLTEKGIEWYRKAKEMEANLFQN